MKLSTVMKLLSISYEHAKKELNVVDLLAPVQL